MSTPDFKNYYIIGLILVLLFGVGVGYQLATVFQNNNSSQVATTNENGIPNNAVLSDQTPIAQPEIYIRTGQVESINPSEVSFSTYVQNSDSNYSKVTMTAKITGETTFTKINLRDDTSKEETITVNDVPVGSEVAVASAENIYGKTTYTASSIQLHQE